MTATIRHCARHNINYKGRCPKCHPRRSRSSSRPVGRRCSVPVYERLVRIEPRPAVEHVVTTATFVARWLERHGLRDDQLSAQEYTCLFQRASALADRWQQLYGLAPAGRALAVESAA